MIAMRGKGFMNYATALIGADADPEVGHHNGETDHHDKDQPFLVRSLRLLRDTPIWKLEAAQVSIMP